MITSRAPVIHALKLSCDINPPCIWYKIPSCLGPVSVNPDGQKNRPDDPTRKGWLRYKEIVMDRCENKLFFNAVLRYNALLWYK